jgi:CubicO group peptidase (beta-lactamase class C family)
MPGRGSYAKAYVKGAAKPQEFVNTLASGGVYSTADNMARIAMMFLSGGRVGTTRILSGASVAEMPKDQTIGSFDPIHNESLAYGLGWDSVSQPGLAAVGFDGWAKGGVHQHGGLVRLEHLEQYEFQKRARRGCRNQHVKLQQGRAMADLE